MKAPAGDAQEPRSPFGCGCGAAMTIAILVVMALAWFSYERGHRFEEELSDPAARDARSREILGYQELPAGYHALGGFSVPFVQEMAMLSDREPAPGEEVSGPADAFGHRGFIYLASRSSRSRTKEVEAYFEGESDHSEFFKDIDDRFEVEEALGRGHLKAGGAEVRYVAERGEMKLGDGDEALPTVMARLLFECAKSSRLRVAMWFEPAPEEPAGAEGTGALTGTPADPAALRRFLDHFQPCG